MTSENDISISSSSAQRTTALATFTSTPPTIKSCKSYKDWKKLIKHWSRISGLQNSDQASAVLLSLTGDDLDAVLQIPETDLDSETGLATLLKRLDSLYLKDELAEKYNTLENFETYRRQPSTSIRDFINEFEKRHNKIKNYGANMTDDLLACRLIRAANLTSDKEQLVRATVDELIYDDVKTKMIKIFDAATPAASSQETPLVKDTFHSEQQRSNNNGDSNDHGCENDFSCSDEEEVYYANSKWRNKSKSRKHVSFKSPSSSSSNWRNDSRKYDHDSRKYDHDSRKYDKSEQRSILAERRNTSRAKNPPDRHGNPTRCEICDSVNHWADKCPDRSSGEKETYIVHEIVLHADIQSPENLRSLVSETWNTGLIDCGAVRTVSGDIWVDEYLKSLSPSDASDVTYYPNNTYYRFGDGQSV